MKKLFLALVVLAVALAGCGKEEAKEEKLLIYAGLMEDHAAMAVKEFEKETGIKTEFVRMSSGETLTRVRAEKDSGLSTLPISMARVMRTDPRSAMAMPTEQMSTYFQVASREAEERWV